MGVPSAIEQVEVMSHDSLQLKSFSLTHILYDPSQPPYISVPLTLLSLSPIFLFVSYFTLIIFSRRLTLVLLALGSLLNEVVSWALKRALKGKRPYVGVVGLGEGYGMPSSHSQAAGFLAAWGVGYALTLGKRSTKSQTENAATVQTVIRSARTGIYVFGLILWSVLTAYSRYYLRYHNMEQIAAGYAFGVALGAFQFIISEYIPLYYPTSSPAQVRQCLEWLWTGIGGVGGWDLGGAEGGWGEGHFVVGSTSSPSERKSQ